MNMADLFCGAGGTSAGALNAIRAQGMTPAMTAVNHWPLAIDTHELNHPGTRHRNQSVYDVDPHQLYLHQALDILWASPECTHHSKAAGGKPKNPQSRATANCVIDWARGGRPDVIFVENVEEFLKWGPLYPKGHPKEYQVIPERQGELFDKWVGKLRRLGYTVDWRVLKAANYGAPTIRERLFIYAVRKGSGKEIVWPNQTHAPRESYTELDMLPWVPTYDIINWEHDTWSCFDRPTGKQLVDATLERIAAGLLRYGLAPYLIPQQRRHPYRSVEDPYPAVTTTSRGEGVAEPFLVTVRHGSGVAHRTRSLTLPMKTVTQKGGEGLGMPYLLQIAHRGKKSSPHSGLKDIMLPMGTQVTKQEMAVLEPYLIYMRGPSDAPAASKSLSKPCPTVTAGGGHIGLCEPVLVGTIDDARKNKYFEVQIGEVILRFDVMFRMLQPDELALAQGFPRDYKFLGTKTEQVKQIGNAVPRHLSEALVTAFLTQCPDVQIDLSL